jgi:hypothetical protein
MFWVGLGLGLTLAALIGWVLRARTSRMAARIEALQTAIDQVALSRG